MRIILDTNILISGSFFRGIPSRILDACVDGQFELVMSPEILDEYRRVGEEFSGQRPNEDFDALLGVLLARAIIVEPKPLSRPVCRDPDDDKFLACAQLGRALVIVSGDKDLLAVPNDFEFEILTARAFMTKYMTGKKA